MSLVRAFVTARHPELGLTWFNRGVCGDTVRDLDRRWEEDVVALKPDWLSVMIGINDIWRAFEDRLDDAVPIDEYADTLDRLVKRAVETTGCKLILADPYLIEADQAGAAAGRDPPLLRGGGGDRGRFGALHVRSQLAYDRALATDQLAGLGR